MNKLDDTIPVSITTKALTNTFSIEEKARREEALANKDFYYDKGDKYIEQVSPDVDIATVNLVKSITKKRTSLLYTKNLVREFDGPATSVSFLEKFYEFINIDKFLYSTDTMAELTGTGLVHLASADNEFGLKLMLFDGSTVSVLDNPQDPNIPDAISLVRLYDKYVKNGPSFQIERILEQQIWTGESVTTYLVSAGGGNPKMENTTTLDLPMMPFIPFKGEDVEGQYLGHSSATGWRKLNNTYNQLLTHLGFMVKMQSATPLVIAGYENGEGITVHPGKAVSISAGATAEILDYNPKINDTLEVLKYIEDKIYESSSVPKVTIIGGNGGTTASSGRELLIQWFPLIQVYQDKTVRYKRYELQLANTILAIKGLAPIKGINVKFVEEGILPMSAAEDSLERDIKLNLKTAVDELMRRNPEMTEEEAAVKIQDNKAFNDIITGSEESEEDPDNSDPDNTNEDPEDQENEDE